MSIQKRKWDERLFDLVDAYRILRKQGIRAIDAYAQAKSNSRAIREQSTRDYFAANGSTYPNGKYKLYGDLFTQRFHSQREYVEWNRYVRIYKRNQPLPQSAIVHNKKFYTVYLAYRLRGLRVMDAIHKTCCNPLGESSSSTTTRYPFRFHVRTDGSIECNRSGYAHYGSYTAVYTLAAYGTRKAAYTQAMRDHRGYERSRITYLKEHNRV